MTDEATKVEEKRPSKKSKISSVHSIHRVAYGIVSILFFNSAFVFGQNWKNPQSLSHEETTRIERAFLEKDYANVIRWADDALKREYRPDILFLKAFSEVKLGMKKHAVGDLRAYLLDRGRTYEEEAKKMLHQLSPNRLDISKTLQVGVGYDSRVVVVETAPELTIRDIDDFAARGRLNLKALHASGLAADYKLNWLRYDKAKKESRFEQRLELGNSISLGKIVMDWRLFGEADLEDYEEDFYQYGGRLESAWLVGRSNVIKIGAEGGKSEFPENHDFDADYVRATAHFQRFKGALFLSFDVNGYWNNAKSEALSFFEYGGGMTGIFSLSKILSVGLSLRGAQLKFDALDSVLGFRREDTLFSSRVWLSYSLSKKLALAPSIQYLKNNSRVAFSDYEEVVAAIDMILKL